MKQSLEMVYSGAKTPGGILREDVRSNLQKERGRERGATKIPKLLEVLSDPRKYGTYSAAWQ